MRFSVRSLIAGIFAVSCFIGLCLNWCPWKLGPVINGPIGRICSIDFSPNGEFLAAGGTGPSIIVWNVAGARQECILQLAVDRTVSVDFGEDANHLLACSQREQLFMWSVWSVETRGCVRFVPIGLASPEFARWVVGSEQIGVVCPDESRILVWDVRNIKRLRPADLSPGWWSNLLRPLGSSDILCWDGGSRVVLSARVESSASQTRNTIFIRRFPDGSLLHELPVGSGTVSAGAISLDGVHLAVLYSAAAPQVFDVETRSPRATLPCAVPATCCAFSPDATQLSTGHQDGTVRVWRVIDGRLLALLKPHSKPILSVRFSRDGVLLGTGGSDGLASIILKRRPGYWWGIFYMLEFWFSAGFAAALVWSLLADKACFARMDAEAARAKA